MTTGFTLFDTPIGACSLVWKDGAIVGLRLPEESAATTRARIERRWPGAEEQTPPPAMQAVIDRVLALLAGEAGGLHRIPVHICGAAGNHLHSDAADRALA